MKEKLSIELKLTDRCNQCCFHCMNSDGPDCGADLDWRLFIRKLEEWASRRNESVCDIKEVRMTGGEPLLCQSAVLEIARSCSRFGIKSGINTNGTLMDSSIARLLKEAGISTVKVSLDASEEAAYQRIRGSSSSLDRILEGIKAAVEFGFKVVLRFTLSRYNRDQLVSCYHMAGDLRVNGFQVKPLISAGRAVGSMAFLSKEEINAALLELADSASGQTPAVEILCWPPEKASRLKYRICGSIDKIYVSTNLQVSICNYVPGTEPIGDMFRDSLENILRRRHCDEWVSPEGHHIISACPQICFFSPAPGSMSR